MLPPDGRFAPSPTGTLHLGNLRTALLAWLFARSAGRALPRADGGPRHRPRPRAVLRRAAARPRRARPRLGRPGRPPVRPARRSTRDAVETARGRDGLVYECWCTRAEIREAASAPHGDLPEGFYPGTCLRLTGAERAERDAPRAGRRRCASAPTRRRVTFEDRARGDGDRASSTTSSCAATTAPTPTTSPSSSTTPAQGIGEVVRGADLLDSTPRQLWLGARLGLPAPRHAHVPLMLGADGARLAKRHGAVTLADRAALGESRGRRAGDARRVRRAAPSRASGRAPRSSSSASPPRVLTADGGGGAMRWASSASGSPWRSSPAA